MDRIRSIIAQSPIDMSDILDMERTARANGGSLLIAGGANARVLLLPDALGLGRGLADVQQPCVVICTRSDELTITLRSGDVTTRCTGIADLAQRLMWSENRGATAEIGCPGMLPCADRLIFAILDGSDYRSQLNAHALGCSGAVIVMDAMDAPSMEVYQFAKWLAEACGLQSATSVFVCGETDSPNCAPAMILAMQMGMPGLPVITCNPAAESIADRLTLAAGNGAGASADRLAQEMARCALAKLAAERERISRGITQPARSRLSLVDRFKAQVPGTRVRVKRTVTAEQGNRLNSDIRDFSIFLQKHIEELLQSDLTALDKPKDAVRTFAQGYLSHVLSGYCAALIGDMVSSEIAPQLQSCYNELLDAAWIRQAVEAQQLPLSALECFDLAVQRIGPDKQWITRAALSLVLKRLLSYIDPDLMIISRLLSDVMIPLIEEGKYKLSSTDAYVRKKADKLRSALDEANAHYQQIVHDTMLPQLESEILFGFDQHVEAIAAALSEEDAKVAAAREQQCADNAQAEALLSRIAATEQALSALAAGQLG